MWDLSSQPDCLESLAKFDHREPFSDARGPGGRRRFCAIFLQGIVIKRKPKLFWISTAVRQLARQELWPGA
jgi:hypothetical protein